jgi:hypothetical protein
VLLFHALRRAEVSAFKVEDYAPRRGIMTLCVHGKGGKIRYVPVKPEAITLIAEYLDVAGHGGDAAGPLFRAVKRNDGRLNEPLAGDGIYASVVAHYARQVGISGARMGPHALRATATTNALEHGADIAKVQRWLGHANLATTQLYDKRPKPPGRLAEIQGRVLTNEPDDGPAAPAHVVGSNQRQTRALAPPVDEPQQREDLSAHGSKGREGQRANHLPQIIGGAAQRRLLKLCL